MKYALTALTALFTSTAFAHSGHVQTVDGHSHTWVELALMGAMPILLGFAAIGLYLLLKRTND